MADSDVVSDMPDIASHVFMYCTVMIVLEKKGGWGGRLKLGKNKREEKNTEMCKKNSRLSDNMACCIVQCTVIFDTLFSVFFFSNFITLFFFFFFVFLTYYHDCRVHKSIISCYFTYCMVIIIIITAILHYLFDTKFINYSDCIFVLVIVFGF